MTLRHTLARHALLAYFGLAFAITWGGTWLLLGGKVMAGAALAPLDAIVIFGCMLLGPSTAGIVMTALVDGRPGLQALGRRMRHVRLPWRWVGVALLTVPLLSLAVTAGMAWLVDPMYTPQLLLGVGLAIGLLAGFFEEIGWTGFATPQLRTRYGVWTTGLLLGVIWALWHLLADFIGNGARLDAAWTVHFLLFCLPVVAYRMLMTWVYDHTGSVPLAQLMHAMYTGTLVAVSPALGFMEAATWQLPFALLLWIVVITVGVLSRTRGLGRHGHQGSQPHPETPSGRVTASSQVK